jgi:diguanylate cyclase (GGDEF)-like protein/PAS domain S-box-containing protein
MTNDEELKYLEMLDAMDEAVHVIDRDYRVLFQNRVVRRWRDTLGVDEEAIGRSLFDVYPFLPERVKHEYRQVFESGRVVVTKETSVIGGRELTTETKKIPIFQGPRVAKVVTCIMDLSETVRAAARLKESEEKYRCLVESTDDSIYLVDPECRYLFMNKKHMNRMGFTGNEFLGRAYADYHGPEESQWLKEKVARVLETGESLRHEHRSRRDGNHFFLTLSPVRQEDGRISAVTVVSKDVTALKNLEEELRSLSLTDSLTGLHNRRGFFTLAELQLRLADRRKQGMYMLYADMDGLKQINDTYGHQEGDRALSETANLLKMTYRSSDVVSRIGGDEFAVIPVGTVKDDIAVIISRFLKNLEDFNSRKSLRYPLSVSIGIVLYDPLHPRPLEELISKADEMMYEQKRRKQHPG